MYPCDGVLSRESHYPHNETYKKKLPGYGSKFLGYSIPRKLPELVDVHVLAQQAISELGFSVRPYRPFAHEFLGLFA
jgi:hypothetical protein